ncbi:hypothetical protein MKW98_017383 [Papaver atlanticum]|uniref:Uncharacterized protein n=1 Tax=Papaver atlanticum TaxID=357466 RepID=A0AAD4SQN4_9MAGN|nr:hypothetical protein MKW98_017383 [Papaver atlanticum]
MSDSPFSYPFGTEDWEDINHLHPDYSLESLSPDNTQKNGPISPLLLKEQDGLFSSFFMPEDAQFDVVLSPIQSFQESKALQSVLSGLAKKNGPRPNLQTSIELLNRCIDRLNKLKGIRYNHQGGTEITDADTGGKLSPQETISLAGARYAASSTKKNDDRDMLSSTRSLTIEEIRDIELVELLLASAESVSKKLFDIATKLVNQCVFFSSSTGNPIQRLVYYFAEALRERIDLVTGRINSIVFEDEVKYQPLDIEKAVMNPLPELLACHETLPFAKVLEFAGMQAIVENVASASRVHLIDFGIRIGLHVVVLMQALATRHECPIELLKVTAVGTMRQKMKETGKRLESFAKSMNIPFGFKIVLVSNMGDIKKELFDIEADEAVAVNCSLLLRSMITNADHLETLMTVIKNLNPCIIVVTEFEGKHNSLSFNNRFIEALFFYSAFFDSFETCMDDQHEENRIKLEMMYCGQGIRNMVAMEGHVRTCRHVEIGTWRAFFARFGMGRRGT